MSGGDEALNGLADKILANFQAGLGDLWEERLTGADRELIEAASIDAAMFLLSNMAGLHGNAAREKAHVEAQLLNIASIETAEAARRRAFETLTDSAGLGRIRVLGASRGWTWPCRASRGRNERGRDDADRAIHHTEVVVVAGLEHAVVEQELRSATRLRRLDMDAPELLLHETLELDVQGVEAATMPPAEFAKLMRDETAKWLDVIRRAGIKGE